MPSLDNIKLFKDPSDNVSDDVPSKNKLPIPQFVSICSSLTNLAAIHSLLGQQMSLSKCSKILDWTQIKT